MAKKSISKALDQLMLDKENLLELNLDDEGKYIFFSDLHRGLKDQADDFQVNSNRLSYFSALHHYLREDFGLVLLGDIEELEEQQNIKEVMECNKDCLQNEQLFFQKNKLFRIWGNHDDKWKKKNNVEKYFQPLYHGLRFYEGILFRYKNRRLLATHGHQGTLLSAKLGFLEPIVLPIYRFFLNTFRINREIVFKNTCFVGEHEQHLYDWAAQQDDLLLICGHTHRPVWGGRTHIEKLEISLSEDHKELMQIATERGAAAESIRDNPHTHGLEVETLVVRMKNTENKIRKLIDQNGMCKIYTKPKSIFFNTGCCIFQDGDITGIEIEKGTLRLVKWGINKATIAIERNVLEEERIENFFTT